MTAKISNGLNDRPRDETIAQTGGGLPNDSSKPIEVSDAKVARLREKLTGEIKTTDMPYDVEHARTIKS